MICRNCNNQNAWHAVSRYDTESEGWIDCCDKCGLEGQGESIPDVYLARIGQTFGALCDDMGKPIPIMSKRHKKEVMDKLGLREHPDRLKGESWIEGSRNYRKKQFDKDRAGIRQTYKEWLNKHK